MKEFWKKLAGFFDPMGPPMNLFISHNPDPWHSAPPWALALRNEVRALRREIKMADKTLDEVLADVADEKTQVDSLSTLAKGIKGQLDAVLAGALTPEQQAKVNAIFDGVEASKADAIDAINAIGSGTSAG